MDWHRSNKCRQTQHLSSHFVLYNIPAACLDIANTNVLSATKTINMRDYVTNLFTVKDKSCHSYFFSFMRYFNFQWLIHPVSFSKQNPHSLEKKMECVMIIAFFSSSFFLKM